MRIGLIGCGVVGTELGARLLRANFELWVFDTRRERTDGLVRRGAARVSRIADLSAGCDALISALPGARDVADALLGRAGAWAAARGSMLHIDTSTIGVAGARQLAEEASRLRIRYLDCPLSAAGVTDSGPAISLFASGNADHFDLARPVLEAIAERVHFVGGPPGKGQIVKLVNNLATFCMTIAIGDAVAMGLKAGLSIELLLAALRDGTAQSRLLDETLPASAFRGDWRPGLRLDLALKDIELAQELSRETGVAQHLLEVTRSRYELARDRGWGDLTSQVVLRLQEEAANVRYRSSIFEGL